MLVLSRKLGERVCIGEDIEVTVLEVRGKQVKLGFIGPVTMPIHRGEIYARIADWQAAASCVECR